MGYDNMESRPGSVSSGQRSSSAARGRNLKSSPFCPGSSSKMAQSLLKDHMVSHYKKIYSAKAAVDTSLPKSLIHSVKYNDQIRRKQLNKDGRPQSAPSVSPRSSRASLYTPPSPLYVQSEDRPYLSSRNSLYSSNFGTSFHANDIVYTHHKAGSQNLLHTGASDAKYQRSGPYKASQNTDRKTYGGDLLKKHSQHFTQDKPFTPKTLKSDKSSYLSKYRYYRAPLKKQSLAKVMHQEKDNGSTKSRKVSDAPSQGLSPEPEWCEDEFSSSYSPETSHQSPATKGGGRLLFNSPPRSYPINKESSILSRIFAEEEEIMYLKLISAVTEDILSRGHISDRILTLVMQRHIDMNRHHLEEDKMRHLMELLRKEFQSPTDVSSCSAGPEKNENGLFEAFHSHLELRGEELKEKDDLLSYVSFKDSSDSPNHTPGGPLVSTPACSPKGNTSPFVINEDKQEKDTLDSQCGDSVAINTESDEVDAHQSEMVSKATDEISSEIPEYSSKVLNQDESMGCCDEQTDDLRGLEGQFSESLHVSSNTAVTEQHSEGSSSDGEF
ncbi:hypothetical protein fugu_016392 [Takifugu bimaculatus]|uniref:Uncharacterized protein n=1 Tax=Takifugu bimaculatus TaxID=433685 RepID=A0A4Z2BT91_9TELE|nr:hypothetical protein fugu_016392 [Takifugu bimaculatus]